MVVGITNVRGESHWSLLSSAMVPGAQSLLILGLKAIVLVIVNKTGAEGSGVDVEMAEVNG